MNAPTVCECKLPLELRPCNLCFLEGYDVWSHVPNKRKLSEFCLETTATKKAGNHRCQFLTAPSSVVCVAHRPAGTSRVW